MSGDLPLSLKLEKCEFERSLVEYLGVVISHNSVNMDPVKVAGVSEWTTPTNKKKVQLFLGFTNFYQRFIEGFLHIARPMFELTKAESVRGHLQQSMLPMESIDSDVSSSIYIPLHCQ